MRIKVGRIIALAYLFCVLAPAASLAWGSGPAPCLDETLLADLVPVHHQMPGGHMHDGVSHDHAGHTRITRPPRRTRPLRIIMAARAQPGRAAP
nr:hypothetical protein [Bradyrhizobium symbiodeficiens]